MPDPIEELSEASRTARTTKPVAMAPLPPPDTPGLAETAPTPKRIARYPNGVGCQRCGSTELSWRKKSSGAGLTFGVFGLLMVVGGFVGSGLVGGGGESTVCATGVLGVILVCLAPFWHQRWARCEHCKWEWRL